MLKNVLLFSYKYIRFWIFQYYAQAVTIIILT